MSRRIRAAHLAYILRPTPLHHVLGNLLERLSERDWERTAEGPAPASVKHRIVKRYAKAHDLKVFIETGTFFGDMIESVRGEFDETHSIELDLTLHRKACKRFANAPSVQLHCGDSGRVLPDLVTRLNQPALFWLDAHWSKGVTARGELDTPISAELAAVMDHGVERHIVLIDDARLFGVAQDYPTIEEIRIAVGEHKPDWEVRVIDDIIHVGPRSMLLLP